MARTGSARPRAAQDHQAMVADEVHIAAIGEAHSGARVGRRYLGLVLAMLAVSATVLVLLRPSGTTAHLPRHQVGATPVQASYAADSANASRLALEEARERGRDPDHDTR